MNPIRFWILIVTSLMMFMLAACGGGGGSGSSGSGTGSLSLSLSDATTNEYQAVYVTIKEVQVHEGGDSDQAKNWRVVASPNKTYNLLELVNGVRERLGIAELGTGHYTQMRLVIGDTADDGLNLLSEQHRYPNYFIDEFNTYQELKIPSGLKTGIKVVQGFDINENDTTDLVLDFDASRSIVTAGNSGQYLLKPTIKVFNTETDAIIHGTVTEAGSGLEGVLISAQTFNPNADDDKDAVVAHTSTITNENGDYRLFVQPASYRLVAYLDGYDPTCASISAESDAVYQQNFTLDTAGTGMIGGSIDIQEADDEQHATVSIRQNAPCGAADEQIEIKSFHIANGGVYEVVAPEGTYTVVASTYGKDTQEYIDVEVNENLTSLDIEL